MLSSAVFRGDLFQDHSRGRAAKHFTTSGTAILVSGTAILVSGTVILVSGTVILVSGRTLFVVPDIEFGPS